MQDNNTALPWFGLLPPETNQLKIQENLRNSPAEL